MFSLFGKKAELGIVYHIGTASVGAGLVRFHAGNLPHVVYSLREPIPYQENVDPERFLASMIEALKVINARLAKDGLAHLKFTEFGTLAVKRVFYVFSSPWAVTETKVATIKEKESFTFTRDRVDRIIEAEEKAFEKEMAGGDESALKGLRAIERHVIDIRLNGYEVADPYGKKARFADVTFLTSLVPEALLEKISDISVKTYHPRDTRSYSFVLASFSVIRDVFHEEKDFIFLDIGSEISDVTVVKNGLIASTASFPLGRHFIVRKVKKALGATAAEAASLIRAYEADAADKATAEKLKPILDAAAEEWAGGFRTVVSKAGGAISLPTKIFVVVSTDIVELFMRALRSEKVTELGAFDAPLSAILVHPGKLKGAVAFGKHAEPDPLVAIAAAFAGRVYESNGE
ncbi:MAG TPA: hypothetical protein VFT82_03150 [Candidatus Paceibacterota bacterium]|nr:hypothetical protein [Candidatus Paceibacterota bacterium]